MRRSVKPVVGWKAWQVMERMTASESSSGPRPQTSTLALRGAKWVALGMGAQKVVQFLVIICLARLLTPDDFGLLAIASLVLALVLRIRQLGLHSALVRCRENIEQAATASLLLNMGLSAVMYVAVVSASSLIAQFFSDPRAGAVIRIMSLQILLGGMVAVPRALTVRALAFRRQAFITLVESVVTGVVSVALALRGFGVWALVYGMLTGSACSVLLWWVCNPWRPTAKLDWAVARELVRFGVGLWSASNLSYLIEITGKVAVGKFLGVVPLGLYEFADRVIRLPVRNVIEAGSRIALPAFCRERQDVSRIRRWYIAKLGYLCLLTAPGAGALIVLADQLVPVVFGPRWLPTVPLVRVLAPTIFLSPLMHTWYVYVSSGRADLLMRFTIVRFAITVPVLLFAARISVFAVCAAEAAMIALFTPINLWIVKRLIGFSSRDLWRALLRPMPATLAAVAAALIARMVGQQFSVAPGVGSLALCVLSALLVYAAVVFMCSPHLFNEVRGLLAVALGRRDSACKQGEDSLST